MQKHVDRFAQWFDGLSQREKLLATGATMAIIWSLWDTALNRPLSSKLTTQNTEIGKLQSNLHNQQSLITELQQAISNDPNATNRNQLATLQQALERMKQQFNIDGKRFVPPLQMAEALRDMLKQHGNVRLIKLDTLPATGFGNTDNQQPVWIYRHGLNLTLQGDYFSTLNYLKSLEALPWRIQWDSLEYQVKDYPLAETRIQVYTLSFEQDWLGV